MNQIDKQHLRNIDDEELFASHVVCGDAELLYLDAILGAVLRSEV